MEMCRTGDGRSWIQVTYPTGDPAIRRERKNLEAAGWRVTVSSMGRQVTEIGPVKMTLITGRK